MLNSSQEYLEALRQGKFVLFLQWPKFVIKKYSQDKKDQDADDTLGLLIFEWLNNGFCLEDVKQIATLYAVYELDPSPISGDLLYSFTSIYGALIPCMVYSEQKVQKDYMRTQSLFASQVSELMKKNLELFDSETYTKFADVETEKFRSLVKNVNPADIKTALKGITDITHLREIIANYLKALQSANLPGDQLKNTRYSMLARLAMYFQDQTEITTQVTSQVEEYIKQIRLSQPADFEEEYLNQLAPLSFFESTARLFTLFSINFFKLVQPQLLSFTESHKQEDSPDNAEKKSNSC